MLSLYKSQQQRTTVRNPKKEIESDTIVVHWVLGKSHNTIFRVVTRKKDVMILYGCFQEMIAWIHYTIYSGTIFDNTGTA